MAMTTVSARWRGGIVLLAAVIGTALAANLGAWQLRRAAQKVALQAMLEARSHLPTLDASSLARTADEAEPQHYRAVHLRGHWVEGRTVFLDNRQMNARVGFYVVTPLQLEHRADAVLVQRGWVARDFVDRTRLPALATPGGMVEIDGMIAPPPARLYEFSASAIGPIRQNLDLDRFAAETGLSLAPLSVRQIDSAATAGDGLLRQWPHPAVDVQKHYGYAFQWFALSALMAGLYVWFQLVKPRLRRSR
ncbi:MAG: SURF1 family protein [Burkholderiaceae bacterium]